MSTSPTPNKIFVGGLSWETTDAKLRAYFENFGSVLEAFVSYDRQSGRPRGFGFVVFESAEVAERVVASKHMIDRREVEAKKAVPKEENPTPAQPADAAQRTRKIFVGGLAPSVDEQVLRQYFEQFGAVDDSVVMYDHDNKRPRGFGFITFADEESVEKVFAHGAMQNIHDKHIEIKRAVPREHMPPPQQRRMPPFYQQGGPGGRGGMPAAAAAPYGRMQPQQYGAAGFRHSLGGPYGPGRPYQGVMSPRSLAAAGLAPGYGGGSPQARGGGGGGYGGMGGGPYGGGQPVPGAGSGRFPAPGGVGGGGGGSRSSSGFPGSMQQPFGGAGRVPPGGYGGLGFGAGGDGGGLVEPGGVSMYSLQQQLQQQQLLPTQHQLALNGMGGGYPGQLDPTMGMPKLGGLTGQASAGAAAAAAAAAIAKHGYGVTPAVGSGGVGAFGGFPPAGQQQFGGGPDPTASYQAAADQAGGGGYHPSDTHGVGHLGSGTSPLGTTPDFASFGAGAGAGWGS